MVTWLDEVSRVSLSFEIHRNSFACICHFVRERERERGKNLSSTRFQFIYLNFLPFFRVKTGCKSCSSLWRAGYVRYIVKRGREGNKYNRFEPQYRNLIILSFVLLASAIARRRCIMHTKNPSPGTYEGSDWVLSKWHLVRAESR